MQDRLLATGRSALSIGLVVAVVVGLLGVRAVPARADDPIGTETQPQDLLDCPTPPVRPTIWSAAAWHNHASNTHCKMNESDQRAGHTGPWGKSGNYWAPELYVDPTPTAVVNHAGTFFNCHRVFIREVPQIGPTSTEGNFGGTMTGTRLQVWSATANITFANTRVWGRYRASDSAGWWMGYQGVATGQAPAVGGRWGADDSLTGAEGFAVTVYGIGLVPAGYAPLGVDPATIGSPTGTAFPNGDVGDRARNDLCAAASAAPKFQSNDIGEAHPQTYGQDPDGAYSADPVNLGTGVFTAQASDLSLPGRILSIDFARWYNSADDRAGVLGPGWTHTFDWQLTDGGGTVEVRRGDGRRDVFTQNPDLTYGAPPDVFDVLTKNADSTFTLVTPSQLRYEFATSGRLDRIHEPAGNEIDLAHVGGELTSISGPGGRQLTLSYSGGRLAQIEDPIGRHVTYAYDSIGRLTTVTDRIGNTAGEAPAEHRWTYGYQGATQHLVTITDPDGRVRVTNTYDDRGRVVEQRDGLNELTTIAYGTLTTTVTDPRGHPTTYTFDNRMRVLSQTDVVGPNTYTVSYTYDSVGNRTSVTDREGNTTNLSYDARGNVLAKTDPSPDGVAPRPVTTFEYDSKNNLTEITDAAGAVTTLSYHPTTNVLLSVNRQVDATTTATTSYEYADPANPGLPTRIYSPRGNASGTPDPTYSTVLAYDSEANLVSRIDADGATTTFDYDDLGRLTSFVDPDGNAPGGVPALHTWTIEYDPLDRETRRTDPLGAALEYGYDGTGNRTSLTDRNGNITTYTYDNNVRLVVVQQKPDPAGPTTYFTIVDRDENGNATRITQGNEARTEYAFDALDRVTGVTTYPTPTAPLTTTYVLDGSGQPTSRTTGDGVTVTYAYDALARLTGVSGPSLSIGYQYDALGRRTQMTDTSGTTTYAYDDLGRVTQIAAPGGALGYEYDLDGNRTELVYPGGDLVTYAYSPGGRLQTVTDWAARTSTYSYTPSGLVDTLAQHGNLTASYTYDRAQRLTGLRYTRNVGGVPVDVVAQAFTLDPEGNRNQLVESGALGEPPPGPSDTFTYEYDGLSRLLSADAVLFGGGTRSETFSYDAATNIQIRTGPAATYTMDGANRVTSDGTQAFTWDGADRLVQRGTDTFTYDALSRLTLATVGGSTSTYTYNGDGLLAARTGPSPATFLWDPSVTPAPLLKAGTDRVVHGLGPLYLARADGSTIRLVRDALGSVRAELDDLGLVTKSFRYAAYGAISDRFPSSATPTLLGFTGELADATGLTYLRARWYDPGIGRFLSKDPLHGSLASPASLNAYQYVAGRPTLLADALGLDPSVSAAASAGAWAYAVAGVFADLDSADPFRRGYAYTTVVAAGVAASALMVAATGAALAGGAAVASAEAAGSIALTAHASMRSSQLGVTAAQIQSAIRQGAAHYDNAYGNIAFFVSRGAGTLQVATRATTEGGASWVVEGIVARAQGMSQIGSMVFKGGQRFLPILGQR